VRDNVEPIMLNSSDHKTKYTVCQKKGATITMAITCQFLMDLQNPFTAAKSCKFPTKYVLGYPPHLKYVAALPWKI